MLKTYAYPKYEYQQPQEQLERSVARYPVVIVGAGPVGMAAAIDCRLHGIPVVLLDEDDTVSVGSRGVCYAKRALEILDRLGVGDRVVAKGVSWNVGRTFFRDEEVFNFNLLPEPDHKRPGMINLQQYYLEEYLVDRCVELGVDMRWKNRVVSVQRMSDGVRATIETPDGTYGIEAEWLIAADGARSPIRKQMGLEVEGKVFQDRFLIADVVMKADFPAERWFWFDPPFHPNQSVLLHRQADNVWRIDFQLGWNADPEEEKKPEKVIPRIKAMLGDEREFELEWVSVYTFQCRRMQEFRHGRVLFVGDAAHQVSPFGARGANSGIQDADNLVWKLKLVLDGKALEGLLDTYSTERVAAADENLMNSTRSTDFITPKSAASRTFRNAVLTLAEHHTFARALVNSGRLSVPVVLADSPLTTADEEPFSGSMVPGAPMDDAPVGIGDKKAWLLDQVGNTFQLLYFTDVAERLAGKLDELRGLSMDAVPVEPVIISEKAGAMDGVRVLHDLMHLVARRYDAREGSVYLLRPDQHVVARWRKFDAHKIRAAVARATCNPQ
ncbi:MAG: FAD-dependent oxidoreductase [Rhodocyclaceae bacterium]